MSDEHAEAAGEPLPETRGAERSDEAESQRKLVCFALGGRELAAPIEQVRETLELRPITPLFRMPPSVAGITNLRGEILAVLDVGVLLGFSPTRRDASARILVCEVEGRSAGLLVERLGPLRDVPSQALAPAPPTMPSEIAALLHGVVSLQTHPLPVLDVARLLDAPPLRPFVTERAARAPAQESP